MPFENVSYIIKSVEIFQCEIERHYKIDKKMASNRKSKK